MRRADERRDELGRLTAALCDGSISLDEAKRLEQLARESQEALRFFLQYVQLHGELHWDTAIQADRGAPPFLLAPPPIEPTAARPRHPAAGRPRQRALDRWIGVAAAVAIALFVGSWVVFLFHPSVPQRPSAVEPKVVATMVRTEGVRWSADSKEAWDGSDLVAGQVLKLDEGLAQLRFRSGARVILEGQARFCVEADNRATLELGSLAARVPPEASGFTIRTPGATIVDRGTEIGIAVDEGGDSEVHVFAGTVEVRPLQAREQEAPQQRLAAGRAVRVSLRSGAEPRIREIAVAIDRFVRALPAPNSVDKLRRLVEMDPHLIHHYTFEGKTREERWRDKRSTLDLQQIRMQEGTEGGFVYELAPGFDGTTTALQPFGVALQSVGPLEPPRQLTVELLLKLERPPEAEGAIAAAVTLDADSKQRGFFGVAADHERLVFQVRQGKPAGRTDLTLVPGTWYYVATTFDAESGRTTVNCYAANLSRGDQELHVLVEQATSEGMPVAGPLGIGKGLDENLADAYPWAGILDEIALYASVLDRNTLEKHLQAITEGQ